MALDACLAKIASHFSLSFKPTGKVHSNCITKTFDFSPSLFTHKMLHYLTQQRPADHLLNELKPGEYHILRYFRSLTVDGTFLISSLSSAARWYKKYFFSRLCVSLLWLHYCCTRLDTTFGFYFIINLGFFMFI